MSFASQSKERTLNLKERKSKFPILKFSNISNFGKFVSLKIILYSLKFYVSIQKSHRQCCSVNGIIRIEIKRFKLSLNRKGSK